MLGPLQNNGGPTLTEALLPGSPAIDAGSNSISGLTVPTTDQRGALRGPAGLNAGTAVDIGAYEASSSYLVTSAADSNDVGTLRAAVGWANLSTNANPANIASPAANTIVFDTAGRLRHAADHHPRSEPGHAGTVQYEHAGVDHWPGCGRDGQRRQCRPGVPGAERSDGQSQRPDDLGRLDHRQWRRSVQRRHGHADRRAPSAAALPQ